MRASDGKRRLPNWVLGLVMVVVLAIASLLAFTKELPWGDKHTVQAVFTTSSNIRPDSPVRIAGVDVGKVTAVEHLSPEDPEYTAQVGGEPGEDGVPTAASVVTMEMEESGLPLHTDATLKLRPRLFLEGNLFVDLQPGSPTAPIAEDGHVFPLGQTSVAVSLDQVLTTLQSDVRGNLQTLLHEFGAALDKFGGAQGLRELYRTSPGAFRYTSEVNEALLGTEPGDLADLIVNLDSTVEALGRNETELQDLVTNLAVVLGSLGAESDALRRGIAELPRVLEVGRPALASLNRAFPPVRAFAREALPGVRSTPETLDAATPLLRQVRGLVARDELRGLVADLRPTIPDLARLSRRTIPFLEQSRALSSCFNEVVIPWSNMKVPDPEHPTYIEGDSGEVAKVFQELGYGLEGIASESRTGDANGQFLRVGAGGGAHTIVIPGGAGPDSMGGGGPAVGATPLPLQGARPTIESSAKTPFRPDVRCEINQPPDLSSEADLDIYEEFQEPFPTMASSAELTPELRDAAEAFSEATQAEPAAGDRSAAPARGARRAALELATELAESFGLQDSLDLDAGGSN